MGITSFSKTILEEVIVKFNPKSVGEYGSQNLYFDGEKLPAPYSNVFYESHGIKYECFDVSNENNCLDYDLTYLLPENFKHKYDLVTDFGCTEHYGREGKHHIEGFYNSWKNKHDLLSIGGVMVNENPKTGNWPGHGFNYYTENFYRELTQLMSYELISLGEHPAMGNVTDGWNIFCVLRKNHDREFISLEEFSKLDYRLS